MKILKCWITSKIRQFRLKMLQDVSYFSTYLQAEFNFTMTIEFAIKYVDLTGLLGPIHSHQVYIVIYFLIKTRAKLFFLTMKIWNSNFADWNSRILLLIEKKSPTDQNRPLVSSCDGDHSGGWKKVCSVKSWVTSLNANTLSWAVSNHQTKSFDCEFQNLLYFFHLIFQFIINGIVKFKIR